MQSLQTAFTDAGVDANKLNLANIELSGSNDMLSASNAMAAINQSNLTKTEKANIKSKLQLDDATKKAASTTAFFGKVAKSVVSVLGSMLIMYAVTSAVQCVADAWDDYIHRLENAKDALQETESQLSSVESEIKTTTDQIRKLEALDPESISITNKEDLENLKAQNEELRLRQQYLELQKQEDIRETVDAAKEKYNKIYGTDTTREGIDNYKEYINKEKTSTTYTGYDLTKTPTASYYSDDDVANESDTVTILLATYEDLAEKKKAAIQAGDSEGAEEYNKKLLATSSSLQECRTELQGLKDDVSATGESSAELDGINNKIKMIDNALLTPGQNLVNFLDSDELSYDKKELGELAASGQLTQEVLEESFSEINDYLIENGLTLQDLISIFGIYKNELEIIPCCDSWDGFQPLNDSF